ncbi:MAG: hypothetical protein QOH56_1197 [Pseudonocardiales bacterium]|jgi:hypothetical protein|nr:hypothetical protein [Pseudonocardiales bacterium]
MAEPEGEGVPIMIGLIIVCSVVLVLLALLYRSDRRAKRAGHAMRTDFDTFYDPLTTYRPDVAPGQNAGPEQKHRH